jgi:hypothetical protein
MYGPVRKSVLPVYEPGEVMKSILLASALWLLTSILMAVFAGKFIKGVRGRHRSLSGGPFSAFTGARGGSGTDPRLDTRSKNSVTILIRKEVRTMSGLQLLIERYASQLKELETRMADVKHKLETVMEASRLLEEEGISEDNPPPLGDRKTSS